jgi:hypothetical protein
MRRLLLVLALLVTLVPMTALAGQPNDNQVDKAYRLVERLQTADDPEQVWQKLSKLDQELVMQALIPVTTVEESSLTPLSVAEAKAMGVQGVVADATTSCWNGQKYVAMKNALYQDVFKAWFNHPWCENGSVITQADTPWYSVWTNLGWHFDGLVTSWTRGGAWQSYYESYQQLHFQGCLGGSWGCFVSKYPWAQMTAYGTSGGTFYGSSGT